MPHPDFASQTAGLFLPLNNVQDFLPDSLEEAGTRPGQLSQCLHQQLLHSHGNTNNIN